jgi:hypothetical protein
MPLHPEDQEWRDIAKQVSVEMDPAKLMILVGKLCHALDERNQDFGLVDDKSITPIDSDGGRPISQLV